MGGNSREKMIFSDKPTQLTKILGQYSHDCVREFSNGFPLEPISKHEKNKSSQLQCLKLETISVSHCWTFSTHFN